MEDKIEENVVRPLNYRKEVRFCEACGGAGMGCPFCDHGLIEDIVILDEPEAERPCNCGKGERERGKGGVLDGKN